MSEVERLTARLEAWFIDKYHLRHMQQRLNNGTTPDEPWKPHIGEQAQAHADAERLALILTDEGWHR